MDAVEFTLAGLPGSMGDGEGKDIWMALEKKIVKSSLADARGTRNNDGTSVRGNSSWWGLLAQLRFEIGSKLGTRIADRVVAL